MGSVNFKPCVVIPIYNHARQVPGVLEKLAGFGLPCVLVNDGSSPADTEFLRQLVRKQPALMLEEQFPNGGKGRAVLRGLRRAQREGCTHVVQVDADGQHDVDDLPKLLDAARACPHGLVTGVPRFDASIPRNRLIGRYVTHFWVWVETLSFQIRDSMCGFRVYPVDSVLALADRVHLGGRMDFDTHIMVRAHWAGLPVISIPTAVHYPADGVSNFRLWRDNLQISWMHTRLVFGMMPRAPLLLWRNFTGYYRSARES